jgi:hypothetical protein
MQQAFTEHARSGQRRSISTDGSRLRAQGSGAPVDTVNSEEGGYINFMALSRKPGVVMSSIEPMIEANVPVEFVHDGRADMVQAGTTRMERFFNLQATFGASQWLVHHPDDERFVPDPLPGVRPHPMEMSGLNEEFTGEPWFSSSSERPLNPV